VMGNNEQIFKDWISQYKAVMFKVVYSFADNQEDQNDLFQEISLQLWTSLPSFRQASKASTWIYRVALNTALTWKRGEKKRRAKHSPLIDMDSAFDATGDNEASQKQEMLNSLYEQIRKLPKVDASLVLMYLDGVSYSEMSEIIDISESNVGVRLSRIKKRLMDAMKEAGNEI
jgi:RNA polymerase sigma-70 factor (ECF subfamily)